MGVSAGPAAISAITRRKFIPKLQDNIQTSNALLSRIPKETLDGGDDIRQPVWYAFSTTGGWYSGAEQLSTNAEDKKTALVFDWKQLYYNITITGLDKLKNAGDSKVIDHVKSEIQIAEGSAKKDFGSGLYSAGTDAKSIIGARVFVTATSTYGGISQSSESWLNSSPSQEQFCVALPEYRLKPRSGQDRRGNALETDKGGLSGRIYSPIYGNNN